MSHGGMLQAMHNEIQVLNETKTWTLTQLPIGKIIGGFRWVYTIKFKRQIHG